MVDVFNEITFYGGGNELMDPMITDIVDQENLARKGMSLAQQIGMVNQMPLSENETYSSVNGVNELPVINENGTKEEMESTVGTPKGYKIVEYGGKRTSSFLFGEWLRTSKTLVGASSDLQAQFLSQGNATRQLLESARKSISKETAKLLTKGFSITTANGPGSATPKGLALFSASHTIYKTGGTFSNLQTGALTSTTLKEAIAKHIAIRLENGDKVSQPRMEGYTLLVSAAGELNAREILNDNSKFLATGTNSNAENIFMFEGSRVKLEIMEELGDYDKDGNQIGTDVMWFLVNRPAMAKAKALKMIKLYPSRVKHYMNDETDQSIVDIREGFAVDHFGAEYFIVGSTGA